MALQVLADSYKQKLSKFKRITKEILLRMKNIALEENLKGF